ncbi:60S ribosomal subunit assembly or modification protein [Tilletia horrida]|nr:60S ribosomal subunit assembly or modification protein [Tilletia horrida]
MDSNAFDEHRITEDDIQEEVPVDPSNVQQSDAMDQDVPASNSKVATVQDLDGDEAMDEDEDGEGDDFTPVHDTSLASFPLHAPKSIFSLTLHPNFPQPPHALSGGEDDKAHIWNTISGELVASLEGQHTDSVISVGWSADGNLVATASMDGTVKVWGKDAQAPANAEGTESWKVVAALEGPDEITWMSWHPKGPVLVAGAQDGTVWMWQLPKGGVMQVFSGHTAPCTCGSWTPDGKRLLTASEDASLFLWDPRSPSPLAKLNPHSEPRFQPFAESGGITSLAISPDVESGGKVAVVGGAGGMLRVVSLPPLLTTADVEAGSSSGPLQVRAVLEGHQDGDSVEAIEFIDLLGTGAASNASTAWTTVVTVSTDGKAIVWDLSTNKARLSVSHPTATALPSPNAQQQIQAGSSNAPKSGVPLSPITSLAVHKGTPMFTTAAAPDPSAIPARPALSAVPENATSSGEGGVPQGGEEEDEISPHGTLCTWDARTGALLALHTGFMDGVLGLAVGLDPDQSLDSGSHSVDAVALARGNSTAGGRAAQSQATRVGGNKRWTVIGAGDEGVALVFRV